MGNKHAFLIMAHSNKEQLFDLLRQIDHPCNDIYLHIDKKVVLASDEEISSVVSFSKIVVIRDIKVAWGAFSQIKCELALLKIATKNDYLYYHLLSGVDCVTKKMDDLHQFFRINCGKEFVHFQGKTISQSTIAHVNYYHFLQEYTNASKITAVNYVIRGIEKALIGLQKLIGVKRWDDRIILQKGANWFSLTEDFAKYVVSKEEWIYEHFRYSLSGDELFIQTILVNSEYLDNLYHASFDNDYRQCSRFIDWNRGKPYIFDIGDELELLNSEMMFARKCTKNLVSSMGKMIGV